MAERRMLAKTIVTSDAFLDMPATSRSLYMLLCVLADDDGFVNNPRSIMRMSGATDDDMKLLIAKRFILTFESGVIVIKHWRIHNLIQKDRYKETKYLGEKATLALDENNAYTECIQDVSKLEPQVRLGKDRLDKVSIGKDNSSLGGTSDEAPTKKTTTFKPPTVEEVRAYCDERMNSVDPETFVDFYSAKGWMLGKNKMKDWKAAIRTWEKKEREQPKQTQQQPRRTGNVFLDMLNNGDV